MVLITGVSLVIHVFSYRYMHDDRRYLRFFCLLGLLTSVLLSLVTSGNLLWLFLYWHAITWLLPALLSLDDTRPATQALAAETRNARTVTEACDIAGRVLAGNTP